MSAAPYVASVALHGAAFAWLAGAERPAIVRNETIQVAVVEKPAPLPPPEPAKPEPVQPKAPPRPKTPPPPPAPTPEAPPPPSVEAPRPTPAPVVITGITLESTTTGGSFALPVGNTLYGRVADKAAAPEEVKPYAAEKYALPPPPAPPPDEPALPLGAGDLDLRGFYPDEAKRAGVEGDVVLRVTVEPDGSVSRLEVVSHPGFGLDAAALRAVREKLRWKPAKRAGAAVRMTVPFTLHFELY